MNNALRNPTAKKENPEQNDITGDAFKPMVYTVKSDTNPNQEYTITNYRLNFWRCSCRDFVFRSMDSEGHAKIPPYRCKHLRKLLSELEGK